MRSSSRTDARLTMWTHFARESVKLWPGAETILGAPRRLCFMKAAMNCSMTMRPVGEESPPRTTALAVAIDG